MLSYCLPVSCGSSCFWSERCAYPALPYRNPVTFRSTPREAETSPNMVIVLAFNPFLYFALKNAHPSVLVPFFMRTQSTQRY